MESWERDSPCKQTIAGEQRFRKKHSNTLEFHSEGRSRLNFILSRPAYFGPSARMREQKPWSRRHYPVRSERRG
jgi:hypothetical protein